MCTNRISFSALRSFAQNRILVIFTFETFSVKKELELSRKRTQKMRTSEAQKYQLAESLIVVLILVDNVDKAQDITLMSKINFTLISPLLDTEFCFSVNKTVKWSQLKSTN